MWTDTHTHLDASDLQPDFDEVVQRARENNVTRFVILAVGPENFDKVRQLAHNLDGAVYGLGIHPLYVSGYSNQALEELKKALKTHHQDPKLAGIGEIGLDGFIKNPDWNKQIHFYHSQLQLAKQFDLPVILHVRKAQDKILKGLRLFKPKSGIAHAFNGSHQQAEQFIENKMKLGFGGAMTFDRAKQIRRLAAQLPLTEIVLETDSPDMAPEWINKERNEPKHIPKIAEVLAELRQTTLEDIQQQTQLNAQQALPALQNN